MKRGNQKDHTKAQANHLNKGKLDEIRAIPKVSNQSDFLCTTDKGIRLKTHEKLEQRKINRQCSLNAHSDQILISNPYIVLADIDIGNQATERAHDKIIPIKALRAYPIQDYE